MTLEQGPIPGFPLTGEEYEVIYTELETRMTEHPEEGLHQSLIFVLSNAGDRYTPLTCAGGEWEGRKQDIPPYTPPAYPVCPNGHLVTAGFGLAIGWAHDTRTLTNIAYNVTDLVGNSLRPIPFPPPSPSEQEVL